MLIHLEFTRKKKLAIACAKVLDLLLASNCSILYMYKHSIKSLVKWSNKQLLGFVYREFCHVHKQLVFVGYPYTALEFWSRSLQKRYNFIFFSRYVIFITISRKYPQLIDFAQINNQLSKIKGIRVCQVCM